MPSITTTSTSPPTSAATSNAPWLGWVKLASLATIFVSLVMLVRLLPVDRLVNLLATQVEQLGVWGPLLFGVVYIAAAVLFIPGSALTLAAGAVFGLLEGFVVVSLASTTAAAVSFLIGRYLARNAVRQWSAGNPRFAAIDRAIGQGGWKIIALLRLSPAMPFSLGNYLFGLTAIGFWPYVLTSWLAMMPGTFMYVYLGYAGRAGLAAAAGGESSRSPAQWALLVVGLLATVAVTVYVTRLARKAIRENTIMPDATTLQTDAPPTPTDTSAPAQPARPRIVATLLMALFALAMAVGTGCAYANRASIAGLFGPPAVTLGETYAQKPDGARFDHSVFDALLKKHVDEAGLVDYRALQADPAALDGYITALASAPINDMGRDERLTLLINAYNAFTLRLIIDHYPVASIKDIPAPQRWKAVRWNLGGTIYSLDQIEHEQIRPHFREPRIHFALVCAAIGCPPLRTEAYQTDRLEEQLIAQSRYVHTRERWFQYDPQNKVVKLTALYNWFAGDFEQAGGSVLDYVASQLPPLAEVVASGTALKIEFLDYDWSLNTQSPR